MTSVLKSDALTTLTTLKDEVGIASADASKDNRLERAINRATQWIEGQTNRKLKARNYNGFNADIGVDFEHKTTSTGDTVPSEDFLFFTGHDAIKSAEGGVLHLPQFPILKVNSTARNIICNPNAIPFRIEYLDNRGSGIAGNETWTALTEWDDYIVEHEYGIVRLLGGAFVCGIRNYRVKCTAGFSVGPASTQPYVPDDLEGLCVEIAKSIYRDDSAVIGESIGSWSRQYSVTLKQEDKAVQATLAKYIRFRL